MKQKVGKYFTSKVELYSSAFFEFANEKKSVSKFLKELLKLKNIISEDCSIVSRISAPIFTKKEQSEILIKLSELIDLPKEMVNFLCVLIQNNRFSCLPMIIDHFELLAKKEEY